MPYSRARRRTSQITLKITLQESESSIEIILEGRVAGPWVAELGRVWVETAPHLNSRKLVLDLRNVTYADMAGTDALKDIYAQSKASLVAGSPWTEYLAEEISKGNTNDAIKGVEHANRA